MENPLHRPPAQAGVAVEGRGDGTAADRPHDQAAAGAGIAEVEHAMRFAEAPDADAVNAPCAFAHALDLGAQRTHRLAGVEYVLAFEQPGYAGLPDRERAEDEGAVRDRLVAGHARAALEGARAAGGEGGFSGVVPVGPGPGGPQPGAKRASSGAPWARATEAGASRLAAIDTGTATRQVKHLILDPLKEPGTVAKPELGTKRLCGNCSAKFYDLNKDPIVCPKCHTVMELVAVNARARPEPAPAPHAAAPAPEEEVVAPETAEAEFVSLEEADAESQGKKAPEGEAAEGAEEEVEIED